MKKITILALHLGYGGIEKCIASLANNLCSDYDVNIVSTYKLYNEPVFEISKKVKIEYLMDNKPNKKEISNALKNHKFITLLKELIKGRKIVKLKHDLMVDYIRNCNSDIIISTRDIHNLWLSKYAKPNVKKIGWEHNHHNNNKRYINKIVKSVSNLDYFILVSKSLKEFYKEKLNNANCKCIYIPNSLDEYPTEYSKLENKRIVSVGRLSYEKGYDELIEVFKKVNTVYPDWQLDIVGDGDQYEKIEHKIKKYNLNNNVELHGFQDKKYINNLLHNSSIYVMSSRSESFGIVLLEAFSYGLPCVAFNRAIGASEIISDNWDGYLVDNGDIDKMAKRICELTSNINRRIIMGSNGIKKANQYNMNIIKEEWIKVIES